MEKILEVLNNHICKIENDLDFNKTIREEQCKMIAKLHEENLMLKNKNQKLKEFLNFLADRLINKYAENPLTDYLIRSKELANDTIK